MAQPWMSSIGTIVAFLLATAWGERALAVEPPPEVLSKLGVVRSLDGGVIDPTPPENGATVVVFYSIECPIANAVVSTINRLYDEFPPPRVQWIAACVDPDATIRDLLEHTREYEVRPSVAVDPRGRLARALGATVTPEAFVLDAAGRLRYHGRIDDQFAARGVRRAVTGVCDLRPAIAAVLADREVEPPTVPAVGCPLPEVADSPTYTRDIAAILQERCQECHRDGRLGPFPLENYAQARKRAHDLANVVSDRLMPPWKAAPGIGPKLRHDRSLSPLEIETFVAWAEAGAPEGDLRDQPAPRSFPTDWSIDGGPDLVLDIGCDFPVPASGDDVYRCFVIPTDLPNDVYVSGVEYRAGSPRVVHHVLGFVDTSGEARRKDAAEEGPGYVSFSGPGVEVVGDLGGWAPGAAPSTLAEGVGRLLPRGADVVLQVHYHPTGKPETDRTRIGLRFARKPVRQTLHWNGAFAVGLDLPPGESNIEVHAEWAVPADLEAWAVAPHMHLLGKDMSMFATFPDGSKRDLIRVDAWDFNWQSQYEFEKPVDLPRGTVVHAVAHFDNSGSNPRNPNADHPVRVRWGEGTTDEMCIGFIAVTKKGQDLTKPGEKDDLLDLFRRQRAEEDEGSSGRRNRP